MSTQMQHEKNMRFQQIAMYRVKLQEHEKLLELAKIEARKNGKKAEDNEKMLEYVKKEA